MRRLYFKHLFLTVLVLLVMPSCLKEGNETILVNDPQDIPFITEYLPEDLLNLFGEENVYFGDQPPVIDMEFKSLYQYEAVVTRFNRKISFSSFFMVY